MHHIYMPFEEGSRNLLQDKIETFHAASANTLMSPKYHASEQMASFTFNIIYTQLIIVLRDRKYLESCRKTLGKNELWIDQKQKENSEM